MKRLLLLFCICLPSFSTPLKVVESTASELVLEWELESWDTSSVENNGVPVTTLFFEDASVFAENFRPSLPAYITNFGVPQNGSVQISCDVQLVETIQLNNSVNLTSKQSENGYSFTQPWISDPEYTFFRSYRTASVAICPFRVLDGKRVLVLKKARFTVLFGSSGQITNSSPPSDYEKALSRLLVNYKVARGWKSEPSRLRKSQSESAYPFSADQKLFTFQIGDGHKDFNEGSAKENGLIRLNGSRLRELFGGSLKIGSVALYASSKNEMDMTVPDSGIPSGVEEIPLMRFDLNGNGLVDPGDYFLAYVSGTSDWCYDSNLKSWSFRINRYDDYRTYWLTSNTMGQAAEVQKIKQPEVPSKTITSFLQIDYYRNPEVLSRYKDTVAEGNLNWVWARLNDYKPQIELLAQTSDFKKRVPFEMRFDGYSWDYSKFTVSVNIGANVLSQSINDDWQRYESWTGGPLSLKFKNKTSDTTLYYEVRGLQLRYHKPVCLDSNITTLTFFSDTGASVVQYELGKSNSKLTYLFRLNQSDSDVALIDSFRTVSDGMYSWRDSAGLGFRYFIVDSSSIKEVNDFNVVKSAKNDPLIINDLRSTINFADYLIVTHSDLLVAALQLAEHKKSMGFNNPAVVLIGDIYNQFSGGNQDPTALRNFLMYVYLNWNRGDQLSFISLLGSGHYDYKGIRTVSKSFIPTAYFENNEEIYCSDDFFTVFDHGKDPKDQYLPSFYLGRLPAKNLSEAQSMVKKIREIESPDDADFGSWRNRVILCADDDVQGSKQDPILFHHSQSDALAQRIEFVRPSVDIRKIHLFEYPMNEQFLKPAATRALVNEVGNGALAVNWIGHGSLDQWADEFFMSKETVAGFPGQNKRYPVFTSFSCSVGKFDVPDKDCVSELLVKQPGAGAIASIASTRLSSAWSNSALALNFYDQLFKFDSCISLGGAFWVAKAGCKWENTHKYSFLGDPSIQLTGLKRELDVQITNSGRTLDTLKALQKVKIKGRVTHSGIIDSQFGRDGAAFAQVSLFAPPESTSRKDGGTYSQPRYTLQRRLLYSSTIPVKDGAFEQEVLLPMNVPFNNPDVKLTAYAYSKSLTAAASIEGLVFSGSDQQGDSDSIGPRISVRPVYNSEKMDNAGLFVTNRIISQLPLQFEIRMYDENGINTSGLGPDEGISWEVENAISRKSINNYQFFEGDYRHLVAVVTLKEGDIQAGNHDLVITAQDQLGNLSRAKIKLEILDMLGLHLDHVFNIPNPMRMGKGTRFYFYQSLNEAYSSYDPQITIKIYSLGGRLLKIIRNVSNGEFWDGRDERGNLLTPNVYLYQVMAKYPTYQREETKSRVKKLVVHPPK